MVKLGYSTGVFWNYNIPLKEKIKLLLQVSRDAIEIMFNESMVMDQKLDLETIRLIRKFKYRSLHAPCKQVYYSPHKSKNLLEKLLVIADQVSAHTILFHPINISSFSWLSNKIGHLLAFENMDARQTFGKTIDDLKKVFKETPQARWVFDVNHLYTNDSAMSQVKGFHKAFGSRLCHYHFSGYGGFHDCISVSKENIIFSGLADLTKPVISEGADKKMKDIIKQEHQYILNYLSQGKT
jgi:hypothetical protein